MFYGQHKEDEYLSTLFPDELPELSRVCVEVGAYDGVHGSNTYHFEQKGWRALCIEPIDAPFQHCLLYRKECVNCCISSEDAEEKEFHIFCLGENLSAISGLEPDQRLIESHSHLITDRKTCRVKVRSLTSLLDELNYPKNIDFISIDTENTEMDVLKGIDFMKYNIKAMVIENNFNEPFCEEYLKQFGYRKIHRIAVNDFYMKEQWKIKVSVGEAVDKLSILDIKYRRIEDPSKKFEIKKEMDGLEICRNIINAFPLYYTLLIYVNEKIWDMTDRIKSITIEHPEFARISNDIFEYNQKRFRIKNWYNLSSSSNIKEQKSYAIKQCKIFISNIDVFQDKIPEIHNLALDYDSITIISNANDKIKNELNIPTIHYAEADDLQIEKTIYLDNYEVEDKEVRTLFETKPIVYISGGLLGDFVHQLSIVYEKFLKTGRKGILYISNDADGQHFKFGLQNAFEDTFQIVTKQQYIQEYKIHNGEPYDINLSDWRNSSLVYKTSWDKIFYNTFHENWAKHKWLNIETDDFWRDKILINTNSYRPTTNIDYTYILNTYNANVVFVSLHESECSNFISNYNAENLMCFVPNNLYSLCVVINSCKLFIGNLSAPLAFAYAFHKQSIIGLSHTDDVHHIGLENIMPNLFIHTDVHVVTEKIKSICG